MIFQNLAQCRRNRSNPFERDTLMGAAFISSADRNFSTAKLLVLQVELPLQGLGVLPIQGTQGVLLQAERLGIWGDPSKSRVDRRRALL